MLSLLYGSVLFPLGTDMSLEINNRALEACLQQKTTTVVRVCFLGHKCTNVSVVAIRKRKMEED